MNIIAVDGEKPALETLLNVIREAAPEAELNGFSRAGDALEFVETDPCDAAFLETELPDLGGVELAKRLKLRNPDVNIIFATGSGQYREAAFALHASGYLTKPVTAEKVRGELAELRRPVPKRSRVRVQAFGNFEVYLDGEPVVFRYSKTKELFAYLIDRRGALCTLGEISAILFEDDLGHENYLKSIRKDLLDTLDEAGCGDVTAQQRGKLGIVPEHIDCDYYDWCDGKRMGIIYRGEYMSQYSWGEYTNAMLERMANTKS